MSAAESSPESPDLFCISCGYNQRGILTDRCPECGVSYATSPPSPTRLPWLHRRHVGLLRAYWRTVFMFLFRRRRFYEQLSCPITLHDGHAFWRLTILHAWLPLAAALTLLSLIRYDRGGIFKGLQRLLLQHSEANIPFIVFLLLGLALFITFATGVPSYFCEPRSLPADRRAGAIAFSYFGSAPLALIPLIVLLLIGAEVADPLPILAGTLALLSVLLMTVTAVLWLRTFDLIRILCARTARAHALVVLAILASWGGLVVLCIFIIPGCILFLTDFIHLLIKY